MKTMQVGTNQRALNRLVAKKDRLQKAIAEAQPQIRDAAAAIANTRPDVSARLHHLADHLYAVVLELADGEV